MLYAVIMRFDSSREIETSMTAEVHKLRHIGIETVRKHGTLSDANAIKKQIGGDIDRPAGYSLLQSCLERHRGFSRLATMVRMVLMESWSKQ